jgi:hypothetical protein
MSQMNADKDIQRISNPTALSASSAVKPEEYLWDGLALLRRGGEIFINEPHPSGGAVVASYSIKNPGVMTFYLNDLLGTTLATVRGSEVEFKPLTAFGQPLRAPAPATAPAATAITPAPPTNPLPLSPTLPPTSR